MNWAKGQKFEDIALDFMQKDGFKLLERNWHAGKHGEIDLIFIKHKGSQALNCLNSGSQANQEKDLVVFIEVKGRNSHFFEEQGLNAINKSKAKKLINSIEAYIEHYDRNENKINYDIRFDLILVSGLNQIIHLKNISLIDFVN